MKHKILYILIALSSFLTSCVQEEVENIGKMQSVVETIIVLPDQAMFKIHCDALKVSDGKFVVETAYAYPADEEFIDGNSYPRANASYSDNSGIALITFGKSYWNNIEPGKSYKIHISGYIVPSDAKPRQSGEYDMWDGNNKDIVVNNLAYDIPDFTFTTPKDMYDALGIDGENIIDVNAETVQCTSTSMSLKMKISTNSESKLKFCFRDENNVPSYSCDYHNSNDNRVEVKFFADQELTDCVYSMRVETDDGYINEKFGYNSDLFVKFSHFVDCDKDYYVMVSGDVTLAYDPENNGGDFLFMLDGYLNKEPFVIHTPKNFNEGYYVITGNGTSWDFANAEEMKKLSGYNKDDEREEYYFAFIESDNGNNWLIVPQTTVEAGTLSNQDYYVPMTDETHGDIKSGRLVWKGLFADSNKLEAASYIRFNISQETFTQVSISDLYYVTGGGWSNYGTHWMPLYEIEGEHDYYGFVNLDKEFKISSHKSLEYAFGGKVTYEYPYFFGDCSDTQDYMQIDGSGFYFMMFDSEFWNCLLYEIKSVELVGNFKDWDKGLSMTPSSDYWKWTAEATMKEDDGFKFKFNGEWEYNLGGNSTELVLDGSDVVCPSDGIYTITLDLSKYPASCTMVKK